MTGGGGPARGRWRLPLLLVLGVGFLLALRPLNDNNIDFHLNVGRWIAEHRSFPRQDVFTYAAAGRDYVDPHWIFQVAAYGWYRLWGFPGLSVASALLTLALLGLHALRMRRSGVGPAATCWVLLTAAVIMNYRYLMRPENVSYLYLALLGILLDRYAERRSEEAGARTRGEAGGRDAWVGPWWLWLVPAIQALWANTQGLFVLGWVVTAVSWAGVSLRAGRPDRPLALAGGASVVACLANPYGLAGVLFPLGLLSRFQPSNVFARNVGEFQPLWAVDWIFEDYLLLAFVVALAVSLAATFRKRRFEELLLPLLFLALALAGVRNVPLFVIVAAPVLGRALTDLGRDPTGAPTTGSSGDRPTRGPLPRLRALGRAGSDASIAGAAVFCVILAGLALRLATGAFYLLPDGTVSFQTGAGLDATMRPVAACEFLLANGLDGRVLNSSNIGGWVEWALPQPAYLDMRLEVVGEDLYGEEVESRKAGGLDLLLAKYRPQLIMTDHGSGAGWIAQLRGREDWRPIFVDEAAAVYARRGYAPGLPALEVDGLAAARGLMGPPDAATAEGLLRRPVPGRVRRWLEGFYRRPARADGSVALGRFCAQNGAAGAAEQLLLEGVRVAPLAHHAAVYDLGTLYAATGRHRLAWFSFDRYLALSPRDERAWNERGVASARLGDPAGAIRDFTRSIELAPRSALVYRNRALARRALGDLPGAREDYSRALRIDPSDEQALRGLSELRRAPP